MPHGEPPGRFRDQHANHRHSQQEKHLEGRIELLHQEFDRHIRDEQHRQSEGEEGLEQPAKGLVRQTRDVEQVVVTPDNPLRAHGPKAHAGEQEHERVMNEDPHRRQQNKSDDLFPTRG